MPTRYMGFALLFAQIILIHNFFDIKFNKARTFRKYADGYLIIMLWIYTIFLNLKYYQCNNCYVIFL